MNIIEIAEASNAEFTPAYSKATSSKDTIVFTEKQLQTFADLIRAEDAKRIAELEKESKLIYSLYTNECKARDKYEAKLAIAIEALEYSDTTISITRIRKAAVEALNKIKGE